MRHRLSKAISILLLLLVPIVLISCSGDSKSSSMLSPSAVRAPTQPPTNLTAKGSDGKVTLMWTPPPPVNAESYPTSYNLYWSLTAGVTKSSSRVLNVSMPFAHLDLTNGTAYYYKVAAANPAGEGPLSAEVRATPLLPFTKILTKLTDPDAETLDEFGYSVAISGDDAIVGAWRSAGLDPGNPLPDIGAAYIFHRTNGVWNPAGVKLMAPDAQPGDRFGYSVSISGEYAIVGALMEDGGPGDPYGDTGAVYVFHRTAPNTNTWDAGTKILAPDPQAGGMFGCSVSMNGDYAIVGEQGESRAYIFHRTGTNTWDSGMMVWVQDTEEGDNFGQSVAINGDYAIVGAYGEDGGWGNPLPDAGAAYIFHRTGVNVWDMVSKIMPHDGKAGDNFGYAVAISGNYAAAGAYQKNNSTGAVYVFHRLDVNFWDEGPKIVAPDAQEGDFFGWSVGITDKYVIVGAYAEDCGWDENNGEGAAYVFERIGANTWDGGTKVTIPQGDPGDGFGYAVAISGESAIIGAVGDDCEAEAIPEAGAVYLY